MCVIWVLSYHSTLHFIDLVEVAKPDERSIMTYVAAFYHAFAGDQKVPDFFHFFFVEKISINFSRQSHKKLYKGSQRLFFDVISINKTNSIGTYR